jgi:hypothetical protein
MCIARQPNPSRAEDIPKKLFLMDKVLREATVCLLEASARPPCHIKNLQHNEGVWESKEDKNLCKSPILHSMK